MQYFCSMAYKPVLSISFALLLFSALLLPLDSYALLLNAQIQLRAQILSFLNIALFITSVITLKQYFWPAGNNRLPFQVFNFVFIILFYALGLPFLIANKEYYEDYVHLSPISILSKFFLSFNISSLSQWVILIAGVFNVLYIKRYRHDYFHAGLGLSQEEDEELEEEFEQEEEEDMPVSGDTSSHR